MLYRHGSLVAEGLNRTEPGDKRLRFQDLGRMEHPGPGACRVHNKQQKLAGKVHVPSISV